MMEVQKPRGSLARLGGLIARLDQSSCSWAGQRQHEESQWEREGLGVVEHGVEEWKTRGETGTRGWPGILGVGWGEEPRGRRLAEPKRDRERERFKNARPVQDTTSCSQKARALLFFAFFMLVGFDCLMF